MLSVRGEREVANGAKILLYGGRVNGHIFFFAGLRPEPRWRQGPQTPELGPMEKKKRMLQNRLFLRCLACLALFGAVRTIHAEVVKGEGDAQ